MAYKNHEDLLAYRRRWRQENGPRLRAEAREKRQNNLAEARAYDRDWKRAKRQSDPETVRAYDRAYFAARPAKRRLRALRAQQWRQAHPERVQELNRAYRATHGEDIRLQRQAYLAANLPKVQAQRRAYRQKNLPRLLAYFTAWKKQHPGVMVMYALRQRARKYGSPGDGITQAQWEELCHSVEYRCVYCGKQCSPRQLTRDHLTPLGEGAHDLHNILPACQSCNIRKRRGPVPRPVQPVLLTAAPSPQQGKPL